MKQGFFAGKNPINHCFYKIKGFVLKEEEKI
jgi:hypothetical protein